MTLALFALALVALVVLPYLPALTEWARRTDATAMPIAETYGETDVAPTEPVDYDAVARGASPGPFATTGELRSAPGAALDAVTAGGDLVLGRGSSVARHAHAGAHLRVGPGCRLRGSASSDGSAAIGAGTQFERLHASALFLGARHEPRARPAARERFAPAERRDEAGRYVVSGDLDIPAGAVVGGTVVAGGTVRLGAGARIDGDVRAGTDLVLGADAWIGGHAFADRAITLAEGAAIDGTAVARRRLALGAHTRVGRHGAPATATADAVTAAPGALVYGTLWARVEGVVSEAASCPVAEAATVAA